MDDDAYSVPMGEVPALSPVEVALLFPPKPVDLMRMMFEQWARG